MRYLGCLVLLAALAACDLPSPTGPVAGARAQSVEVAGSTFSVRVSGQDAVAVRTNTDFRARRADILPKAGLAMELVSGCRVRPGSLDGDVARVEGRLDC